MAMTLLNAMKFANKTFIKTFIGFSIGFIVEFSIADIPTPSFNCSKASTNIEKLICSDSDLASLDSRLSTQYRASYESSPDSTTFKQKQIDWLKNIRSACSDIECLKSVYSKRLIELTPVESNVDTKSTDTSAEEVQAEVRAEDEADKNLALQEAQIVASQEEQRAAEKTESDKAAAELAAQAQKVAVANALDAQKQQSIEKAASDKLFWDGIKAGVSLLAIIAAIAYALIRRKRKNKRNQTVFDNPVTLHESNSASISNDGSIDEPKKAKLTVNNELIIAKSKNENKLVFFLRRLSITQKVISVIVVIFIVGWLNSNDNKKPESSSSKNDLKKEIGIVTAVIPGGWLSMSYANSSEFRLAVLDVTCTKPGGSKEYLIRGAGAIVPPNGLAEIKIEHPFPEYIKYGLNCRAASVIKRDE